MSNDLTDNLPRDTNPMLEEILAEVRALGGVPPAIERLEAKIDDLHADMAGTRRLFREELVLEAKTIEERLAGFDRRIRALEERTSTT